MPSRERTGESLAEKPLKKPVPLEERAASREIDPLAEQVGYQATRKLRARQSDRPSVWFGLGLFGIVGWSVALPTVLGALLGVWLDRNWPSRHSWTLALLAAGLVLGCASAWQWLRKQHPEDRKRRDG
ncbi:MAG: AtpZ/AtpI family protein [Gammaproteobacteria bacterium]|nr:AtpZ/AtpI family protein [Gammaproteobacteria bacterium]MCP5195369.1 AtpZ/AtpI family protein [Gammaproteobacteria bacterium]